MPRFTDALDQHSHQADIQADKALATKIGISGTPAFVVGGYFISGAQPYAKFKRAVKRALEDRKLGRKPGAGN